MPRWLGVQVLPCMHTWIAAGLASRWSPSLHRDRGPGSQRGGPELEAEPLLRLLLVDLGVRGYQLPRARPSKDVAVLDFLAVAIDELPEGSDGPLAPALGAAAWVAGWKDRGNLEAFLSAARRRPLWGRGVPARSPARVAATTVAALQGQFAALEARLATLGAASAAGARAGPSAADTSQLRMRRSCRR